MVDLGFNHFFSWWHFYIRYLLDYDTTREKKGVLAFLCVCTIINTNHRQSRIMKEQVLLQSWVYLNLQSLKVQAVVIGLGILLLVVLLRGVFDFHPVFTKKKKIKQKQKKRQIKSNCLLTKTKPSSYHYNKFLCYKNNKKWEGVRLKKYETKMRNWALINTSRYVLYHEPRTTKMQADADRNQQSCPILYTLSINALLNSAQIYSFWDDFLLF